MTIFSWKTVVTGAAIVMLSSLFDFQLLGKQLQSLSMMCKCKVQYGALNTESILKALREYSKGNHPDLHKGGVLCAPEVTNEIRDGIRKFGMSRTAYLLYKLGTPISQVENAVMLLIAAFGLAAFKVARAPFLPRRVKQLLVFVGVLAQPGEGVLSPERQLMKKVKHAEFVYGTPPCALTCGATPSQCTANGWFYKDRVVDAVDTVVAVVDKQPSQQLSGRLHLLG